MEQHIHFHQILCVAILPAWVSWFYTPSVNGHCTHGTNQQQYRCKWYYITTQQGSVPKCNWIYSTKTFEWWSTNFPSQIYHKLEFSTKLLTFWSQFTWQLQTGFTCDTNSTKIFRWLAATCHHNRKKKWIDSYSGKWFLVSQGSSCIWICNRTKILPHDRNQMFHLLQVFAIFWN